MTNFRKKLGCLLALVLLLALSGSLLLVVILNFLNHEVNMVKNGDGCLDVLPAVVVKQGVLPESFENLDADQIRVAAVIIKVGEEVGVGTRGQLIGLIVAMQESSLGKNTTPTGKGRDAGVFQQRTAPGWYGTVEQVNDPAYGARIFYEGKTVTEDVAGAAGPPGYHIPGLKNISDWEKMTLAEAAQSVQRSAYPGEYAKHEALMRLLMKELAGTDAIETAAGNVSCDLIEASFLDPGLDGSQDFIHPTIPGTPISSPFGTRLHPVLGIRKMHQGVDYANSCGTPVYATRDGVVGVAGWWGNGAGTSVNILHSEGVETHNYHLQAVFVVKGERVKQGQKVGLVGTTGTSTGCHLHFGIKMNGNFVDPALYISN